MATPSTPADETARPAPRPRPVRLQPPYHLEPGDIVLARSDSLLGRAIRWAERGPGESPTWANHTGMITRAGNEKTALMTEALWRVVERPLGRTKDRVEVWRHRSWHASHRQAAVRRMKSFLGCRYGWWKLFLHLTDALISRLAGLLGFKGEAVLTRRVLFAGQPPICSWAVAWAVFAATGLRFKGRHPRAATPDDIHDHLVNHGDWELVYTGCPGRDSGKANG